MNIEKAKKAIKTAWILALVSGGINLIFIFLLKNLEGEQTINFGLWNLIDVLLVFGLAFGIYKKCRVCAVIMFAYFLINQLNISLSAVMITNIPLALVFLYYFFQGIRGTFYYHKLIDEKTNL